MLFACQFVEEMKKVLAQFIMSGGLLARAALS